MGGSQAEQTRLLAEYRAARSAADSARATWEQYLPTIPLTDVPHQVPAGDLDEVFRQLALAETVERAARGAFRVHVRAAGTVGAAEVQDGDHE